jgi:MMP 1-O-methyltransferase
LTSSHETANAQAVAAEIEHIMSIEGFMTRRQVLTLMRLAAATPAEELIVEIGTYRGRSTVALALGARRGLCRRIYAVDPHIEFVTPTGTRFGPDDQAVLYRNLVRMGVGDLVYSVSLPSAVVARGWPDRNVGLLLLDGDHRYEAVRDDVNGWLPHLVDDAVIVFDDIDWLGVERVVSELVEAGTITQEGRMGKLAWFRTRRRPAGAPNSEGGSKNLPSKHD